VLLTVDFKDDQEVLVSNKYSLDWIGLLIDRS